jgi:hypothetical protein
MKKSAFALLFGLAIVAGAQDLPPDLVRGGVVGGDWGKQFLDAPKGDVLLLGFEVHYGTDKNNTIVHSAAPIWLTNRGEVTGAAYGAPEGPPVIVKAKPGYAVGGMEGRGGTMVDSIQLTFMKITATGLDPADSYKSDKIGGPKGGDLKTIAGNGNPVVGIYGGSGSKDLNSLGLLTKAGAKIPVPAPDNVKVPVAAQPDFEIFATADDEYELFLNGTKILSGRDRFKAQSTKLALGHGDVLTAIVKDDQGGQSGEFGVLIFRGGREVISTAQFKYTVKTPPADWVTSKSTDGLRPPKVFNGKVGMGTHRAPKFAWSQKSDQVYATVYFKYVVP